jgi:cephalosporin hydroxylase
MWTAFWPLVSKRVIIPDVRIVIDSAADNLSWFGHPIRQLSEDLTRLQEVVCRLRPVIVETGVSGGGVLIFNAMLCQVSEIVKELELYSRFVTTGSYIFAAGGKFDASTDVQSLPPIENDNISESVSYWPGAWLERLV